MTSSLVKIRAEEFVVAELMYGAELVGCRSAASIAEASSGADRSVRLSITANLRILSKMSVIDEQYHLCTHGALNSAVG